MYPPSPSPAVHSSPWTGLTEKRGDRGVEGGSAGPRRALVTGAAGGIGRAAAARLAAEGASVAILDVREQDLAATAEQLRQSGADVLELPADVGDEQQVAAAVATVTSRWGGLDAAVAAAGISMSITG